ncbi:LysR family transcriptional regulator [Delftia acidovorans]|uniref:LysR family transcriptional regulator n=1 Tax=Delftia acidovorans TaxID=80866 RepID=A0AAJ2R6N7_DELAC|nr:LysR family transcriptional regulator [Delftia acidovorans]MDX4956679.1 LysR family transcriptional regulator [Delftia acidovorans]
MPLDEMLVFARVVEHQSFAGAARQLGLTTSAVSRSVGRLEAHFGLRLLQRTTRSLSLTEAGAEIHQACLRLVEDAQAVQALAGQLRQQPRGLLKISASAVLGDLWLSPLLPGFCARWPEVQVQVDMTDRMVDLVAEGLDLGLRISMPGQIAPGLVARPLKTIRYVLVATPGYLARHAQITEPGQLLAHPFISLGYGQFQNEVELRPLHPAAAPATRLLVNTPITIASSLGIIHALQQGPGIGVVADFAAQAALQAGQLAPVLPGWALCGKYAPRVVHAVYAPTRHVPLKLRALIDYLVEVEGEGATASTT